MGSLVNQLPDLPDHPLPSAPSARDVLVVSDPSDRALGEQLRSDLAASMIHAATAEFGVGSAVPARWERRGRPLVVLVLPSRAAARADARASFEGLVRAGAETLLVSLSDSALPRWAQVPAV